MKNRQMSNTGSQVAEVLKDIEEKIFCTEQDKKAYNIMNEKLNQEDYFKLLEQLPEDYKKFKCNIKEFTSEDIVKAASSYLDSKSQQSDIVIETAEPSYFACSIQINNHKLNTGIGGFKMFLSNLPNLDMLKVSFNGVVLTQKEKQELYDKYR